jgi:DNA polymerase (family 10)
LIPTTIIATLFQTTGSPEFIHQFDSIDYSKQYPDEAEIFQTAGIRFLIPEMRNGTNELQWLKNYANDKPIDTPDIKGIIHAHSTWSDGIHSIEEIALYCMQSGWEYLIISDHSASAFYAQGLKTDRVIAQHKEIDALNHKLAPFKIFKSIESDILIDGSLDYPDEILERFDCIIASVHSTLNMDLDKATNRLLRAIENPFTTILGHPTGRLLLSRSGYPIDTKKIIDACARNKVVIELNANPWRLDIDWSWIYEAMDRGVQIAINPDAHSVAGIHDIHYGTLAARKGGLIKKFLFNNLNVNEMTAYLEKRKSAIFKK